MAIYSKSNCTLMKGDYSEAIRRNLVNVGTIDYKEKSIGVVQIALILFILLTQKPPTF